jgi:phage tail-like protein
MGGFSVNSQRQDPYKNFKFLVKFDNTPVAALSKCSGLKWTTEIVEWREMGNGGATRKLPGRVTFTPITLEAGVTHDTTFLSWAAQVRQYSAGSVPFLGIDYRRDFRIELLNEQGTTVMAYTIRRAWVSEFQALPDLDSNAHSVAITSIKVEHEGFVPDTSVKEPKEDGAAGGNTILAAVLSKLGISLP